MKKMERLEDGTSQYTSKEERRNAEKREEEKGRAEQEEADAVEHGAARGERDCAVVNAVEQGAVMRGRAGSRAAVDAAQHGAGERSKGESRAPQEKQSQQSTKQRGGSRVTRGSRCSKARISMESRQDQRGLESIT
jgi:hypothetical protein